MENHTKRGDVVVTGHPLLCPTPRTSSIGTDVLQRLKSLETQLHEERRRRMNLEQNIRNLQDEDQYDIEKKTVGTSGGYRNVMVPPPPRPLSRVQVDAWNVIRPPAVHPTGVAAAGVAEYLRQQQKEPSFILPPLPIPFEQSHSTTAGSVAEKKKKQKSNIGLKLHVQPLPSPLAHGGKKPPLPAAAKARRNDCATFFSRKRVSDVDLYLSTERHQRRVDALALFELPTTASS